MRITADTNLLVRLVTGDDVRQSEAANATLLEAEIVALALPALCELVWVLSWHYKINAPDIADALKKLVNGGNVVVDRPAVAAGLAMLEAGGDFADGVIAHAGGLLGGETFISFDKRAVNRLQQAGRPARLIN